MQERHPLLGLGDETLPGVSFKRAGIELVADFWRVGNVVAFVIGGDALGDMDAESLLETQGDRPTGQSTMSSIDLP